MHCLIPFFCFEIIVCYFKDKYYINGCGSWPSEKGLREIVETQTHIWSFFVCLHTNLCYLLCICLFILPVVHWVWSLKVTVRLLASHFQVLGLLVLLNWLLWLEGQKRNLLQPKSSSAAWEPTWCIVVRLEPDRYEPHSYVFILNYYSH